MRFSYPINEWGVDGDIEEFQGDGRLQIDCVIGVEKDSKGNELEYITEPMFLDLLESIQTADARKMFNIYTNIQQVPAVIFMFNNTLIIHNDVVQEYMQIIRKQLENVQTDILMDAIVEDKIIKYTQKKGNSFRALEAIVRGGSGINFNSRLIAYVVQQMIYESEADQLGIQTLFNEMENIDIIRFIGAVKEYGLTEETRNVHLSKLLDNFAIEEIENAMNREITNRYFLGMI
jgi:hypothetical protein